MLKKGTCMKRRKSYRSKVIFRPEIPFDFEKIQIRTDFSLVRNLYLESDKNYNGRVELLTDKIIKDYIKDHEGYRRITTYIGYRSDYAYNVRLHVSTKEDLDAFCALFDCGVYRAEVIKAALYQWELNLRERYEGYYTKKKQSRSRDPLEDF